MTENELQEKYQKFLMTEFVVFDLETSGLDPVRDEILEIAAVKMVGAEIKDRFVSLVRPGRAVPKEAEKIHGLNEIFLLVNGRELKTVMADFLRFLSDAILVGHNIREFDWLFVLNNLKRLMMSPPANKMIDTLELSRKLINLPRYNLGNVAAYFGLEHLEAHRALPDVEVNAKVFVKLMDKLLGREDAKI